MGISVPFLLVFLQGVSSSPPPSHKLYAHKKKYQSAGGEWDTAPVPRRHRGESTRSQVSPDGTVRVEAAVRTSPQVQHVKDLAPKHAAVEGEEHQVVRLVKSVGLTKTPNPDAAAGLESPQKVTSGSAETKASVPVIEGLNRSAAPADITVLIYDTTEPKEEATNVDSEHVSHLLEQVQTIGWKSKLVGVGSAWQGWGSKLTAMLDEIKKLDPKEFIIVADPHDILVNTAPGGIKAFAKNFQEVTANHPGAIVIAADGSCCAAAMNQVGAPGHLIAQNGDRTKFSCSSGIGDCLHKGAERDQPWKTFFKEIAEKRGFKNAPFPYLNAGILAGYGGDIVRVYELLKAKPQEDDQALLSEAMHRRPDWLVVDYEQRLFGSNGQQGCQYDWHAATDDNMGHFRNHVTNSTPLFIQTSGQFMECYLAIPEN